jgi:hypothetical protein
MQCVRAILTPGLIGQAPNAVAQETSLPDHEASLVVQRQRDRPSNWRQADTDHLIVISDGSERELARIA